MCESADCLTDRRMGKRRKGMEADGEKKYPPKHYWEHVWAVRWIVDDFYFLTATLLDCLSLLFNKHRYFFNYWSEQNSTPVLLEMRKTDTPSKKTKNSA